MIRNLLKSLRSTADASLGYGLIEDGVFAIRLSQTHDTGQQQ